MSNSQDGEAFDEDINQFDEQDIHEVVSDGGEMMGDSEDDANHMDVGESGDDQIVFEDNSIQGFFGHNEQPVYCISAGAKRMIACSGGGDDMGHLWRIDTGEEISQLNGHSDSVSATAFNFDESIVATGGLDGTVICWSVDKPDSPLCKLEGPDEIVWLKWHPKGNVLVAGSGDGNVWMWNVTNASVMHVFSKHTAPVSCGEFTPDGKHLVTASEDGTLVYWDPKTGSALWKVGDDGQKQWHESGIISIAVDAEGKLVATGDETGKVCVCQLASGKLLNEFNGHSEAVEGLAFAPDSNLFLLASGSMDGKVILWDLHTNKIRSTLKHGDGVNHILFNDQKLICASVDRQISVWNYRSSAKEDELKGHQEVINDIVCVNDFLVTAGEDGVCLVFK